MKSIRVIAISLAMLLFAANAQAYLIDTMGYNTAPYPAMANYVITDTTPDAATPGTVTLTVYTIAGYTLLSGVVGAGYTLPSTFSWKILGPGIETFSVDFNPTGVYSFYLTSIGALSNGLLQLDKVNTATTPAPLAALLLASGLGGLAVFKRRRAS